MSVSTLVAGDGSRPDPPTDLLQTGQLVLGPGARKDMCSFSLPLSKLTYDQNLAITKAKKYAMEQSIKVVLMKQTHQHHQTQAKTLQRHQAVVLMCRIYIGSINFEVREETLRNSFLTFGPIRSVSMSWDPISQKHKGFAFIEYEVAEAANLALEQMNGVLLSNRNIKVGRPSNMPQAQAIIEDIIEDSKAFNRVYVAAIHADLTQDDIKSVFEAFGPIKVCDLVESGIPGRHRGYAFIEYENKQGCIDAISSMNMFDLGGQFLRVGRCNTPPDIKNVGTPSSLVPVALPTAAAVAAAAATAKIQAMDAVAETLSESAISDPPVSIAQPSVVIPTLGHIPTMPVPTMVSAPIMLATPIALTTPVSSRPSPPSLRSTPAFEDSTKKKQHVQDELQKQMADTNEATSLQQQESLSIKGTSARHLVMQKLMRTNDSASKVLLMNNMVRAEDVDDELHDEISDELSNYGEVEKVVIYQEKAFEGDDAPIEVKIFVEFVSSGSATKALEAIHGRFFGGLQVRARLYDQELFTDGDLSG